MGYLTQRFMKHQGKTLQDWVQALNVESERAQAAKVLAESGAEAVPLLSRALQRGTLLEREHASRVLGQLGGLAAPVWQDLARQLPEEHPSIRRAASEVLCHLAGLVPAETRVEIADEVAKLLLNLPEHSDPAIGAHMRHVLEACAAHDPVIAEAIKSVLEDARGKPAEVSAP